jgi:hypothetical protein
VAVGGFCVATTVADPLCGGYFLLNPVSLLLSPSQAFVLLPTDGPAGTSSK